MSLHLDYLRHRLAATATWRQCISKKYAFDFRNEVAKDICQRLSAVSSENISAGVVAQLSILHGPGLVDAVQQACREIGFKYKPDNLEDVACRVVEICTAAPAGEDAFAAVTR
jgi:hypothetical protein